MCKFANVQMCSPLWKGLSQIFERFSGAKLHICIFAYLHIIVCNISFSQTPPPSINLNQVGFYTGASKLAVVTGETTASKFYILSNNDTVFRGDLGAQKRSAYSSTVTRLADFTSFKKNGSYVMYVPGLPLSPSFEIGDHVHRATAIASLKAFYFMRSNVALPGQYAGKWKRGAGHPDTAVYIHASAANANLPEGTIIASPGGWYDAGDYNKYIVNSGIIMGTLLSAYEDFTQHFKDLRTGIPSQSGVPDILTEIIYNLRWMLTMQDPSDGGVYHKCTNAEFDGMVMPGITKAKRFVVQKSTPAALNFAAVTAQAARVLRDYGRQLPGLSDSCMKASQLAWKWALKNPNTAYDQRNINAKYDPDINTGEYGDRSFNDEWLWAAAELFALTNNKAYYDVVLQRMRDKVTLPSWNSVGLLGYYTFIRNERRLPSYAGAVLKQMKDSVLSIANRYISNVSANAFGVVMGQSRADFVWGSNAVAANQGILLIMAFMLSKDKRYLDGALHNVDYILGRNATGYCFVTGTGMRSPVHLHHRPSEADGVAEPVPGLLAGGPNPGRQDNCKYAFTEAETAYTDDVCSYASNEIAINWNAPLVYLVNAVEVLFGK